MFAAAGSSFWSPSAPQMWEHCRPSSPSSVILLLYHLGLGQGVENECCSWFFVLVTLSPTVVGALSAQLTQLNGPFPPSALFRGLPRCWRVCQHGYHFFIFSHFILSTSCSTAGSLPVKEHSTADSLRVKEDRPPPWPVGTTNSNYIAGQEAPAEALPKFSLSSVRDIKIQVQGTPTHCHH